MTSEFLLEAIGQLDDELVLEAANIPARRGIKWGQVAGWAAAIVLCVGIARIPGLLPMNGAATGAAEPQEEAALNDVLKDKVALDSAAEYEYRSDQESAAREPSAAGKADSKTEDGAAQGVFEPKFFTQRGVYLPTDMTKQKLPPEDKKALGELVAAVHGQSVYPATGTQELVGCPVWESEDGEYLYVQTKNGVWITARLLNE